MPNITIIQEEFIIPSPYCFISTFRILQSSRSGLNISTRIGIFECVLAEESRMNFGVGGLITKENIIALREFLTDVLNDFDKEEINEG